MIKLPKNEGEIELYTEIDSCNIKVSLAGSCEDVSAVADLIIPALRKVGLGDLLPPAEPTPSPMVWLVACDGNYSLFFSRSEAIRSAARQHAFDIDECAAWDDGGPMYDGENGVGIYPLVAV